MGEWIGAHPWAIPVAIIAVAVAILKAGMWIGAVNTDRASFTKFMDRIDADLKDFGTKISRISGLHSAGSVTQSKSRSR